MKRNIFTALVSCLMCLCAISANAQSDYYMSMPNVKANGGSTVTVPVSLTNAGGIFSLQIEVYLPDGVDLVSVQGTERTVNAEYFDYSQNDQYTEDNQRRRRIYIANVQNMMESAISGNDGVLINITFQLPEGEGVYPIQLKNLQYLNPPTFAINYMDDVEATITTSDYFFTMPDVQASCGDEVTVPLYLNNADGIFSLQIDLFMPDGVEFVGVTGTDRINAEFFQSGSEDKYNNEGQRYRRVLIGNISNLSSAINGNEGILLYYTLKVQPNHETDSYLIRISNIQYFNPPTYALHYIDDAEATISLNPSNILGDVDHDGVVNVTDVTTLIYMVLTGDLEYGCNICGDINGDSIIDVTDVTLLINYVLTGEW